MKYLRKSISCVLFCFLCTNLAAQPFRTDQLDSLERVLDSYKAGAQHIIVSRVYVSFSEAYAVLPHADSAEYYLKKAQNCLIKHDGIELDIHHVRSMIEANRGDYRSALESYKRYHHLSDSILKAGKTTEMAQMKNWYELEQKEHENRLLQQEHQKQFRQTRILTTALVMILALLALSVFLYRKTVDKNRELKKLHTVKDKLFSVVAHDLRNPMSALVSILKLVNRNMLDVETQNRMFKDISIRVDHTCDLLENLLRWAKTQMMGMAPIPSYFDVREESCSATDSLQNIADNKNIAIENRIEQQQVYTDRDMFATVVRNLTMNAIKFTFPEGKIILASELSGDMLVISVADNGTGMTQEVQDQLSKLSETGSLRGTGNETGTGLGLVLCDDFVKANGGKIWFTSKPGEGSTFYFSVQVKGKIS